MKFIDISNNNNIDVRMYLTLYSPEMIVLKASEGVGGKDRTYDNRVSICRELSTKVGHYHFCRYDDIDNTPQNEMRYFSTVVKPLQGEPLIIDFEVSTAGRTPYSLMSESIKVLKKYFPNNPIWVYANSSTIIANGFEKLGVPLWVANYGVNNGEPNTKPTIANMIAWQYTSVGKLNGYSGYLDLNIYYGNSNRFTVITNFHKDKWYNPNHAKYRIKCNLDTKVYSKCSNTGVLSGEYTNSRITRGQYINSSYHIETKDSVIHTMLNQHGKRIYFRFKGGE